MRCPGLSPFAPLGLAERDLGLGRRFSVGHWMRQGRKGGAQIFSTRVIRTGAYRDGSWSGEADNFEEQRDSRESRDNWHDGIDEWSLDEYGKT